MHLRLQLALVAACLCLAHAAAPERARKQRPTRGFKNLEMMTARGFGKRDHAAARPEHEDTWGRKMNPQVSLSPTPDFGKRDRNDDEVYGLDNFWEMLEGSPERDGQETVDEKNFESIPVDWFVKEMLNNPDFARSVVRKFVDVNQDGVLTSEELLRNVV